MKIYFYKYDLDNFKLILLHNEDRSCQLVGHFLTVNACDSRDTEIARRSGALDHARFLRLHVLAKIKSLFVASTLDTAYDDVRNVAAKIA